MPDAQNLAKLRDIHLPEVIGWWPPAPAWYGLAVVLLLLMVWLGWFLYRVYRDGLAKRQALKLLAGYQNQHKKALNSQVTAARVSELLRRVALVYYPRDNVAGLKGDAWLAFLHNSAKGVDFKAVRALLLELPYQPDRQADLEQLFKVAEAWIRQRRTPCSN